MFKVDNLIEVEIFQDYFSLELHRLVLAFDEFVNYLRFEQTVSVFLFHFLTSNEIAKLYDFLVTFDHRHLLRHLNVLTQEQFLLLFLVLTRVKRGECACEQIYLAVVVVALH